MPNYLKIISLLTVKKCWYVCLLDDVLLKAGVLFNYFTLFIMPLNIHVVMSWNQKVAAVLDEMPLSLHDKYLFCIR